MGLRRAVAVGVGVFLPVLLLAPAQADDIENYWDGVWHSHHEGTKLMVLNLEQKNGSREVTGTYKHPRDHHGSYDGDKGKIVADVKGEFGKKLKGTYKSTSGGGRGGFEIRLKTDQNSWKGEFWPCRYRIYCTEYDWTGARPEFD